MYTAGELRAAGQDDPDTWQRGAAPRDPRHLQTRARHAHIRAQVRPRVSRVTILSRTCDVLQPRQRLPASPHHPELHDEGGLGHGRGAIRVLPREGVAGEPTCILSRVTMSSVTMSRVRPATPSPISLRRPASPRAGRCWPGNSGEHNK